MVIEGGIGEAAFEIPFESGPRGLVQGHEAALPEFGVPDEHAIRGDILKAQPNGLRHAQSGACKQGEERAVGLSPERMTGLSRRVDEPDNVVRGKDVGCAPGLLRAAKDRRRQFVGSILGTDIPGEANHVAEAAGALVDGLRQS